MNEPSTRHDSDPPDLTQLLNRAASGDASAARELMPIVYRELRGIAVAKRRAARAGETLRTTALVHEAYVRVFEREPEGWQQRSHFFYAAAVAMRDLLVEEARRRSAGKRGGGAEHISIDTVGVPIDAPVDEVLALHRCLGRLEDGDEIGHRIVMYRFFIGMTMPEIAEVLETPIRTIERKWTFVRTWLAKEMRAA